MHETTYDEISFADQKVFEANDAVSNQISLVFRLKECGIDAKGAEDALARLHREQRQWTEYRTLLRIRKGMTERV